jgi:phospholipid/cholesterol/gamma-HCH transport system substrate-binding protein
MQHIDPAKLNATLSSISDGLSGRGSQLGETLVTANQYLSAVNPHLPQLQNDFQQSATVANMYANAAPDFMGILDHFSITADTVTTQQDNLNTLLLSAIGFGNTGTEVGNENKPKFVSANDRLVPTTELLAKYSPQYPCMLQTAVTSGDVMEKAIDKTGYSLSVDAALLFGDNMYEYPKHLPKLNAKGGPGGQPGCFAAITKEMYPQPYLVTDTGVNLADATSIRPNANPSVLQLLLGNTPDGGAR